MDVDEIPSHRACAPCRSHKVRCIPDDGNPDVCQRCARSGRPCVFMPLQKRKQRKRTDTRVAELEKEMRNMRAMLKQKDGQASSSEPEKTPSQVQPRGLWFKDTLPEGARLGQAGTTANSADNSAVKNAGSHPSSSGAPYLWPVRYKDQPVQETRDVIDTGLVSLATARQLVDTYRNDLYPHYPLVYIPPSVTADELRQAKPVLFLAIIAAASSKEEPDLSAALDKEVLQAYATRSLVHSQKSLELVQALLVSAVWYHPPSKFGQLKYYEYIHMAAVMAMDIGIGSGRTSQRGRYKPREATRLFPEERPSIHPAEDVNDPDLSMTPRSREGSPDTESIESRRTFLGCYIICASVSLSLRRPNMLRVSSYIRECVDVIEKSSAINSGPHSVLHDGLLVSWVRLIMIAEEISVSFCYDDPGGIASIAELRIQMMLKGFETRLSAWHRKVPDHGSGSMMIMYYTIRLYLFEIALHVDHSPEDFRAPYQMGEISTIDNADDVPTPVLAEAVSECILSAHSLLSTFLIMDVEKLRGLPVFSYVRISFAAFVLAKLSLSAVHPQSRIGRLVHRNNLQAEIYLDRAILHVRNVAGPKKIRVPSIFLALLFKLRSWCLNPTALVQPSESTGTPTHIPGLNDDCPDDPQCPANTVIEIDGPRIVEHISSDENSPQALGSAASSGHSKTTNSITSGSYRSLLRTTPNVGETASTGFTSHSFGNVATSMPDVNASTSNVNVSDASMASMNPSLQQNSFESSGTHMNMNDNIFQFLGDMGSFPEGGLTGLDDWSNLPHDLNAMTQADLMHWQFPSTAPETTGM